MYDSPMYQQQVIAPQPSYFQQQQQQLQQQQQQFFQPQGVPQRAKKVKKSKCKKKSKGKKCDNKVLIQDNYPGGGGGCASCGGFPGAAVGPGITPSYNPPGTGVCCSNGYYGDFGYAGHGLYKGFGCGGVLL